MTDAPIAEAGKLYFGFICKNPECGLPIIIGEIPRENLDAEGGVKIVSSPVEREMTCLLCGFATVYRPGELQRFRVVEKGKLH